MARRFKLRQKLSHVCVRVRSCSVITAPQPCCRRFAHGRLPLQVVVANIREVAPVRKRGSWCVSQARVPRFDLGWRQHDFQPAGHSEYRNCGNDISESSDPTAKMVRQILGAVSEFEKNSIVLKLRTARKRMKAEMGRCEGRKPYGDREGEAEVIALMKSLRRKRPNQKRMSYDRIGKTLKEEGIKTRSGSPEWKSNTIRRILAR